MGVVRGEGQTGLWNSKAGILDTPNDYCVSLSTYQRHTTLERYLYFLIDFISFFSHKIISWFSPER